MPPATRRSPWVVALDSIDADDLALVGGKAWLPADLGKLAADPSVRALIQAAVEEANARYAKVAQIKKFVILDHDLSPEAGELTATFKVKR